MNYYNSIARGYEELHKEEQIKKIKLIKRYLKVNPEDKLLDVGCGTGITTKFWKCRLYGIDPSKKLLEKARKKYPNILFKLAPAEKIPFKDNLFNVVISVTAIQNFQNIEKALKEIKRVGNKKFILTFLRKSKRKSKIDSLIRKTFNVKEVIEEEKDLIYITEKKKQKG